MRDEFLATDRKAKCRYGVGRADHVDLRSFRIEVPAQLHEVGETVNVIRMHVCEEHRIDLCRSDAKLGQTQRRPAGRVELQLDRTAIVGVVAVTHECARPGETVEFRRPSHRTSQVTVRHGAASAFLVGKTANTAKEAMMTQLL